ncbi:hypothetical protein SXCC_00301 [Gluconacetobacter sp. SXCC-1]|nr:hypothetical protein SXCC_00301 [Gluconacetobacter sp. SXCC-1]
MLACPLVKQPYLIRRLAFRLYFHCSFSFRRSMTENCTISDNMWTCVQSVTLYELCGLLIHTWSSRTSRCKNDEGWFATHFYKAGSRFDCCQIERTRPTWN